MGSKVSGSTMCTVGGALGAVGIFIIGSGFAMGTTAEFSQTLNIGLLNDQSNRIILGGFTALAGAVVFSAGAIIQALTGSTATNPPPENNSNIM